MAPVQTLMVAIISQAYYISYTSEPLTTDQSSNNFLNNVLIGSTACVLQLKKLQVQEGEYNIATNKYNGKISKPMKCFRKSSSSFRSRAVPSEPR